MNTALNYVLISGKLGFPAMGTAVVSLGLLSTAKYQRKAQRSGFALERRSIKTKLRAQRSGSQFKRKKELT